MQAVQRICGEIESGWLPRDARAIFERISMDPTVVPGAHWIVFSAVMQNALGCTHLHHGASVHVVSHADAANRGASATPSILSAVSHPPPFAATPPKPKESAEPEEMKMPLVDYPDSDTETDLMIQKHISRRMFNCRSETKLQAYNQLLQLIDTIPGVTVNRIFNEMKASGFSYTEANVRMMLHLLVSRNLVVVAKTQDEGTQRTINNYYLKDAGNPKTFTDSMQ